MFDDPGIQIESELGASERLLWAGRPRSGILFRVSDLIQIPFSLLWGGFAIAWQVAVVAQGSPIFMTLWGIPFVIVGLHMMFGRFWVDAKRRSKTYYGVTDERIIIISGVLRRSIKSINLDLITDVCLKEKSGDSGTIVIGPTDSRRSWTETGQHGTPTLEFIDGAREVYELIRESQRVTRKTV